MLSKIDRQRLEATGIDVEEEAARAYGQHYGWSVSIIVEGALDGDTMVSSRSVAQEAVDALHDGLDTEIDTSFQVRADQVYLDDEETLPGSRPPIVRNREV